MSHEECGNVEMETDGYVYNGLRDGNSRDATSRWSRYAVALKDGGGELG